MMRSDSGDARRSARVNTFAAGMLCVFLLCLASVWFIFADFTDNYHNSIISESAEHLTEINQQIKLFLEERFSNDYMIVESLANSISVYDQGGVESILDLLRREKDIWGILDIEIYAENGFCIGTDGQIAPNDKASDMIYQARRDGEFMQIVQSTITYTLPVDNGLLLNGSPMAAVSMVQDLNSLIDDMRFESFGGAAYIYLTQTNGAIISHLTHPRAKSAYNLLALIDDAGIQCMTHDDHALSDLTVRQEACAFICNAKSDQAEYLITVPIDARGAVMRLFYFVPEAIVNNTMLGFSADVSRMSIIMIGVFTLSTMLVFILFYRLRKRSFDSAMVARDRMFDLLVSNTRNAFALLSTRHQEPLYSSSNVEQIIGDKYLSLVRTEAGLRMVSASGRETEAVLAINQALEQWDGKSEFVSRFAPYIINDATRYFIMRIYPVGDTGEEFVTIAQDVTGEREREEALKTALVMADAASLAKTRFLANMSHDIRTPMNVIINMTDFALETMGEPHVQQSYLRTIRDSSDHLLRMINDILDMSRIEAGQVILTREPFDLHDCLVDICQMIAPLYQAKEQSFTADIDGIATRHVAGDKVKLTRVLVNLLNNAVKFTRPGGHISLTVREAPSLNESTASYRFVVRDDGEGIAPENIAQIFEPFSRLKDSDAQRVEGSGLGLSICRSYVNAMGGTVSCESQPEHGSAFTVELFFEIDTAPSAKPQAKAPLKPMSFAGKRALLCEDHVVNQTIACKILEKLGFRVSVAGDGKEAVRAFEASEPGCFDIIYMDIQMPVMDGYEATRAIRASAHPDAQTIPIIAMTANVFAEDVEKARVAGMNGHLGKPLMAQQLAQLSGSVLTQSGQIAYREGNQ